MDIFSVSKADELCLSRGLVLPCFQVFELGLLGAAAAF